MTSARARLLATILVITALALWTLIEARQVGELT